MADYYSTLGVDKSADAAALKKAFRKQAMQYHPDRNPDDAVAEKKFKEVNEAYDVLSDSQKRSAYDRMGHAAFKDGAARGGNPGQGGGGFGGGNPFGGGFNGNVEDIFADFFGDMMNGGGGRGRAAAQNRGSDLQYNLTIDLTEAYNGTKESLTIPTAVACDTCDGSGGAAGAEPVTCDTCGGQGAVRVSQGFFNMTQTCPTCQGTGTIIKDKCRKCKGEGRTNQARNLNVDIPAGVDTGTRIRLSGKGEAGRSGGQAGDLYVMINVKPHKLFKRDGDHLHLTLPVGMIDAALGTEIEIPTPDGGRSRLKIPAGTQPNQTFRLKGKGMPRLNTRAASAFGDLMVHADIEIPNSLTAKQKDALEEIRDTLKTKNTPQEKSFFNHLKSFWDGA